jgi:uncharacterized protein (DUF433 family)
MKTIPSAISIPLRADEDGTIRVGKTRVILDLVIYAFRQGATPETIVEMYPSLSLADVYVISGFYLENRAEIDHYIQQQETEAAAIRLEIEKRFPQEGIRARLLARMENQEKNHP